MASEFKYDIFEMLKDKTSKFLDDILFHDEPENKLATFDNVMDELFAEYHKLSSKYSDSVVHPAVLKNLVEVYRERIISGIVFSDVRSVLSEHIQKLSTQHYVILHICKKYLTEETTKLITQHIEILTNIVSHEKKLLGYFA